MFSKASILAQLDEAAEHGRFMTHQEAQAGHLHAFSDSDRWALAMESYVGEGRYLYVYGNCLLGDIGRNEIHPDKTFWDVLLPLLPGDLPKLLQIDQWNHPDHSLGQKPSQTDTFVMLAEVIKSGDLRDFDPLKLAADSRKA